MSDLPPPPENPFAQEMGADGMPPIGGQAEALDTGRPNVAARPGRMLMVIGSVGAVLALLLISIFSGGKKQTVDKKDAKRQVAQATLEPPPLPATAPALAAPPALLAPPTIPQPANVELIKPEDNGAAKKQAMDRLKSKMMLVDGGGGSSVGNVLGTGKTTPAPTADPNSTFEANAIAASSQVTKSEATKIDDLRHTIAQGRIIQATTESAINTDLPAPIRAIVSRDTYAEAGTEPLIPKGSRLIGTYNTDLSGGQSRVFVVWSRVIRPDGVDIQLGSPMVDQLGSAGVSGQVDDKFQQTFSRSLLASVISIAFAVGADKVSGGSSTTTTTSGAGGSNSGSSTTSGDVVTTGTTQAITQLGTTTTSYIQRFIDARPTILVDQGTPVNVFVNRDLVFPAKVGSGAKFVN